VVKVNGKEDGRKKQESPLPQRDPRNAVTQRMLKIPYRIIW